MGHAASLQVIGSRGQVHWDTALFDPCRHARRSARLARSPPCTVSDISSSVRHRVPRELGTDLPVATSVDTTTLRVPPPPRARHTSAMAARRWLPCDHHPSREEPPWPRPAREPGPGGPQVTWSPRSPKWTWPCADRAHATKRGWGGHEAHWGALDLEIGGLLRWRSAQREKPMSQLSHEVMPQVIR